MLEVAIIGAGNIGSVRGRVIARSSNSRVRLVADANFSLAQKLANAVEGIAVLDPLEAATDPKVDVVVVSTPTKFHNQYAVAALRAGKHVLCEKPLARTTAEATNIIEASEARNRILKTGFNYRYMAHVRKAKEIIEAGGIGDISFVRCRYGHGGRPGYEHQWCTDQDLSGGGVLLEQGIHILDLFRYLVGEVVQLMGETPRFFWGFPEVEDNCFLLLKTASSQTAQIHVSWTQWVNVFSLEIFGRDGYLHLTGRDGHYGPQRLVWGMRRADHSRPHEEIFNFPAADDSWEREWEYFTNAIHTGNLGMGHAEDSLRALEMVEAAYESSRRQAWIDLSESRQPLRSSA
jgi:predicted dehydrogenase